MIFVRPKAPGIRGLSHQKVISLFAGPGGVDQGFRLLDLGTQVDGYDIDSDACASATAAGFQRKQGDVTQLDPDRFQGYGGAIITPPCPPFSRSGLGKGMLDFPKITQALALLGDFFGGIASEQDYLWAIDDLNDPRSALVVETLRFALLLPDLEWLIAEQVPGVAPLWREIGAELAAVADWIFLGVVTVASEDLGVASRRPRTFLIATRRFTPDLSCLPVRAAWTTGKFAPPLDEDLEMLPRVVPVTSMARALSWPAGELVNTRGNRRPTGGNLFSADGPAWCLTEKARSWFRVSDGLRLTPADAGLLMGFPADFPWQGSRSKCFLQAADAVSPVVAAAVLGATLGLEGWQDPLNAYVAKIYN